MRRLGFALALTLALWTAPTRAEAPGGPGGWQGARWGMSVAELAQLYGERAVRLDPPRSFGALSAPLTIKDVEVAGQRFDAFLETAADESGLRQVALERQEAPFRRGDGRLLVATLRAQYGEPTRVCETPGPRRIPGAVQYTWTNPGATVHLTFLDLYADAAGAAGDETPEPQPAPAPPRRRLARIVPDKVVIRYHDPRQTDLDQSAGCRPVKRRPAAP